MREQHFLASCIAELNVCRRQPLLDCPLDSVDAGGDADASSIAVAVFAYLVYILRAFGELAPSTESPARQKFADSFRPCCLVMQIWRQRVFHELIHIMRQWCSRIGKLTNSRDVCLATSKRGDDVLCRGFKISTGKWQQTLQRNYELLGVHEKATFSSNILYYNICTRLWPGSKCVSGPR